MEGNEEERKRDGELESRIEAALAEFRDFVDLFQSHSLTETQSRISNIHAPN